MADKAAGAISAARGETRPLRSRRMKLQTDYGQAVMWSKGFAAEETKAAFARAAELAAKSDDFSERFAAAHGQWTMALVRGELRSARELASAFLREAEDAGRVTEAGVARRGLALICYLHGDFVRREPIASGRLRSLTPSTKRRRANASARTPGPWRPLASLGRVGNWARSNARAN